jgi:hypothetical protein
MSSTPNRIAIYTKDVQNITGRSERSSRNILTAIRKKLKKKRGQLVTVEEFCTHTGCKPGDLERFLK